MLNPKPYSPSIFIRSLSLEDTYSDRNLETELVRLSGSYFKTKAQPSLLFSNSIGNMYTPSLYGSLASYLISKPENELHRSRIILFSYGSGVASSMFSLIVNNEPLTAIESKNKFTLTKIIKNLTEKKINLDKRVEIDPIQYDNYLHVREKTNKKGKNRV